jgi:hypothetical protein
MAKLQAVGLIGLNGITFGPETQTLGVSIKPVADSSGRTIVANLYTFTIKTKIIRSLADINADIALGSIPSNDGTLADMRRQLMTYGGEFFYTDKGLGYIHIDGGGAGTRDLAWGPKVEELSWKPVAGGTASEVILRVSFKIMDCDSSIAQFGIMEFCYKIAWEQGRDRLDQRHYTGHLVIPQTRNNPNDAALSDTADAYYERVAPTLPVGWRREHERRELSEDKCRLDFTFVDIQEKTAQEPYMIDSDWDHEQSNNPPVQQAVKTGRISAWYEVASGYPLDLAQRSFRDLWTSKFADFRQQEYSVLPMVYNAHEYGRTRRISFSVTYRIMRNTNLPALLGPAGFYQPSPTANAAFWAQTMAPLNAPRGTSNSRFTPDQDIIINLCNQNQPQQIAQGAPIVDAAGDEDPAEDDRDVPPADKSWVQFQTWLEFQTDDGVIEHKPLPTQPQTPPAPWSLGERLGEALLGNSNGPIPVDPGASGSLGDPPTLLQQRTTPITHVWLVGFAERLCYSIPEPILVSVAGNPAVRINRLEAGEGFAMKIWQGPVVIATWRRRYTLTQQPTGPLKPVRSLHDGNYVDAEGGNT